MSGPITRRQALGEMLVGTALIVTGCGGGTAPRADASGSTLRSTWRDPRGIGRLAPAPGEPLVPRTELGRQAAALSVLATLAHVTDAHVLDAESPARVTFLDRLGPPFQSTFRPHETLTAQVLAGVLRSVRALSPDVVVQGGDLIDNDQANELALALDVLRGGTVSPGSGARGYVGVQSASDADPFYYRPDLDAPLHLGLLTRAASRFTSPGAGAPWLPVLGDHDILVAGEIAPTGQTRSLALGGQAVWDLPPGLTAPPGLLVGRGAGRAAGVSPDGPPAPGLIDHFLAQALGAPKVRVPPDPRRRELDAAETVAALQAASRRRASGARLDYHADIGPQVRVLMLDLARRAGGSGGIVVPGQADWLAGQLAAAGDRWILVISHQPLTSAERGDQILELLDRHPRVIAAISGHVHRNRIVARPTAAGGYWLISTASLIDYPQQARALRVLATSDGVAIRTWMLDHVFPGDLGTISRELAYLDAQGGRAAGFAGDHLDRNVTLYRARGPA
jgi:3',5'-cyclic AMP phosphodiesterase CpdA